jgi:hypothetical protein
MTYPTSITFSDAPATVTLDDGTTYDALMTGSVTPTPASVAVAPATLFGVDPSRSTTTDFAQDIAWFTGAKVGAAYGQVGEGCLPWSSPWVAPMVKAGYRVTFSAKDYTSAVVASFVANWDTMPAPRLGLGLDPHEYYLFHEANRPSGGPVLSTWKPTMAALVAHAADHKNRDRILLGVNFSWWPAAIGKDGVPNEGTPWWSFMVPGLKVVSWDQYWGGGMTGVTNVDQFTALPWQSGQDHGLPVNIREFGVSGSQTDATAAKVIAEVAPVYRAKKFAHVAYFNFRSGVSGAWLTKTGRPLALAAWQRVCAGQGAA